jgi:hypothetical protein
VVVGQAGALDGVAQVRVVGAHEDDVAVERVALPAVEEVDQAVVVLGDQHGDALAAARVP